MSAAPMIASALEDFAPMGYCWLGVAMPAKAEAFVLANEPVRISGEAPPSELSQIDRMTVLARVSVKVRRLLVEASVAATVWLVDVVKPPDEPPDPRSTL